MVESLRPGELADWLMARGRHFITTEDAAELLGVAPRDVRNSLRRPREARAMLAITKGGWIPVPPEHRSAGAPPPSHYIDALMNHLGHPYYVGFLSAAALHGAAHQAPMVFQVATPAVLRDRSIGRGRIRFIRRVDAGRRATLRKTVPTGRVTVSTPEVTVFDLVDSPRLGGGLSNIATVIGELIEDDLLDPEHLAQQAGHYPRTVTQRVGYMVETMGEMIDSPIDLESLAAQVAHAEPTRLASHREQTGRRDDRWSIVVNVDIEPDL